jgi:hypothetical protein
MGALVLADPDAPAAACAGVLPDAEPMEGAPPDRALPVFVPPAPPTPPAPPIDGRAPAPGYI